MMLKKLLFFVFEKKQSLSFSMVLKIGEFLTRSKSWANALQDENNRGWANNLQGILFVFSLSLL